MGLTEDFDSFKYSPESKKPAFLVREDWREWQEEQAYINGDIAADGNPNKDYAAEWVEPDFFEPSEEELDGLELVTKLTRKNRSLGFDKKGTEEDDLLELPELPSD